LRQVKHLAQEFKDITEQMKKARITEFELFQTNKTVFDELCRVKSEIKWKGFDYRF